MGTTPTWPGLLNRLVRGEDLTTDDTRWAMREVMTGEASPTQVAGFLVALRAKGESPEEVAGLAATMVELATPVSLPLPWPRNPLRSWARPDFQPWPGSLKPQPV